MLLLDKSAKFEYDTIKFHSIKSKIKSHKNECNAVYINCLTSEAMKLACQDNVFILFAKSDP